MVVGVFAATSNRIARRSMKTFDSATALVTGAASGIGRSAARSFARRGAAVVVSDINLAGASAVADEISAEGGRALAVRTDVADPDAFTQLRDAALAVFGRIDLVMNNAAVISRVLPDHTPDEEWERVLTTNVLSVARSNRVFVPLLLEQGHGHIVNTASFAGLFGYSFDRLPYAASKAAVVQLSEGLAMYLHPQGVGVTVLCPGPVATGFGASIREVGPQTVTRGPGAQFERVEADVVGELVADGVLADRFMLVTHEAVREVLARRAGDWDGFVREQEVAIVAEGLIPSRSTTEGV
jgi:NAD(P)-dependent dehydrogenase (short-subunit alcohol dehydrogenase family)